MADKPKPKPTPPLRLNRTKHCNVCQVRNARVLKKAPIRKGDSSTGHVDPDYTVAVCPKCDLNEI